MSVKILSSDVIAKIAAGEVVDRPSSVVKELLENAIDAGASSVEILLADAGKESILIKDNGSGIARSDLETIFQRHATSKIRSMEDLDNLSSMGFRGEALYSIGAVSAVTLKTNGWQLNVRGGERLGLQPSAVPERGTHIEIAQLFFNTPARRKFLKNTTSEMTAILNAVLPYGLIYPQLRLALTHNSRSVLDFRPTPNRLDRIAHAFNCAAKDLIETEQELAAEGVKIRLTLGCINVQRARRDLQFIFINNRPVDSKTISFNLNDMYKLILPPGVYGAFVVELHLNPTNVDVNIHPTKREVRLHGEARIISALRRLAESALMQQGAIKTVFPAYTIGEPVQHHFNAGGIVRHSFNDGGQIAEPALSYSPGSSLFDMDQHLFKADNSLKTRFAQARYIGQWINKFLLFEEGKSLFVVDQHAAQERIMFEKFRNQIENGKIEIQPLLTPTLVKLTASEHIVYDDIKDKLDSLGIETTQFDSDTIAIQTQPVLLKDVGKALRTLLAGDDVARCDRHTLASRACKASIVSGDPLNPAQVEHQRRELLACQDPFTCPHGRPTVIELTEGFIDRQFLRS